MLFTGKSRPPLLLLPLLASLVAADLLQEIEEALKNAVDCTSCHALLVPLQTLADLGNETFVDTLTTICDDLGVEDPDVCAGTFTELGPIIAHDLREIDPLGTTATSFCNAVFGLCLPPDIYSYTVPFPSPAPANPKVWTSTGKTPFQVVHFSDVHIDTYYTVGSEGNCTKPICCRNYANETGPIEIPAGPYGSSLCDAPPSLAQSMYGAIEQFAADARFSIFTGDVVPHDIWSETQPEVISDLTSFSSELEQALGAPVYPTLGNHDSWPVNSFPRNTTDTNETSQWVFDLQSSQWSQWIGSAAASQVEHDSGSYAYTVPGTNLTIISLNTIYWYKDNFWMFDSDTPQPDPNGVLAFLVNALQAAEDAGYRAWVIGHVPPGISDMFNDQSNYYNQIVVRYANTIVGHFFGHTHIDQFEVGYSDYSDQTAANAVAVSWICPSLTPTSGNPSFKIYDVDPDTYEIMDARVYIANISAAGYQSGPTWYLYYSARDSFGPFVPALTSASSLNPAFWHNLTEAFAADDTAFQLYNTYLSRGGNVTACTGACVNTTICGLRAMRAEDNCYVPTPGIQLKRSSEASFYEPPRHSSEECEGTSPSHIFKKLVSNIAAGRYSDSDFWHLRKRLERILR